MLPFTGVALVRCAGPLRRVWPRVWVLATAVAAAAAAPIVIHDARPTRLGMTNYETGHPRQERRIGLDLRAAIQRDGGHVLVDTYDNLD